MAPRSWRKTFFSCKTGKSLREDLRFTGAEKEFTVAGFLSKTLKKRGGQETCNQENVCLKFSQTEGKLRPPRSAVTWL